jgi:taurine dioxygenase
MGSLSVKPLQDGLGFGARISGVTHEALRDEANRAEINAVFEARGLIVFENVEPSSEMHVGISNVFGPLKDHPNKAVARVDQNAMPGVIDMHTKAGEAGVVEVNGKPLASWLPWHFDHCYNNELNRAGVLRALEISPDGGKTGFVDGIELYRMFSPSLREQIEKRNILYRMDVVYETWRFGRPERFAELTVKPTAYEVNEVSKNVPRALHPAVWTRKSGEKVLHVSPWMAQGIQGQEDAEGDALLEAVCQEINAKAQAYYHSWTLTDMLIWDNWRMLHCVSGIAPTSSRRMQRTTIKGDYGLGSFENNGTGHKILEMTV